MEVIILGFIIFTICNSLILVGIINQNRINERLLREAIKQFNVIALSRGIR